jgi:3-hydroxyisobutyrate dehydrogenase-like beta-hydroxyacid dehydrogenase
MERTLGFIGLGHMGAPMARRLREAGFRLTVHDLRREAVEEAASAGAVVAGSPREVADTNEVVLASLPTPLVVRDVVLGDRGVVAGSKVRTFVDLSTTGPKVAQEIAAALGGRGITAVDAPVSGGVKGASKGTLAVMVAGPRASFDALQPALAVIGKLFYVGAEPGMGQTMKLVNNLLSATALAITSEAIVLGAKAGLDPGVMLDVINAGSGRNTATLDKFPGSVLDRSFKYGFATGLMRKDLRLCLDLADAQKVPMWVAAAVERLWFQAECEMGPQSDFTQIVQCVERWAGVEVKGKTQ